MTDSGQGACIDCGKTRPPDAGRRYGWRRERCAICYGRLMGYPNSTAAVRRYRSDPEKRERDRERSRRWKREKLGQPGLSRIPRAT